MGDWRGEDDHPGWRKVQLSLADLCGQRGTSEPSTTRNPPPPPPQYAPQPAPAPAPSASRWPLFAGIGIAVVALAAAGGMILGRGSGVPAPAETSAAPVAEPQPVAAAPAARPAPAAPDPQAAAPAAVAVAAAPAVASAGDEEAPPQVNPADMTFPDSSTRLLQPSEVNPLGPTTLKIARNEIFARKGMRFTTPFLQQWFGRYGWYRPQFDRVPLNPIERANIELIRQAEARYGG
jgi:hypothetical protein